MLPSLCIQYKNPVGMDYTHPGHYLRHFAQKIVLKSINRRALTAEIAERAEFNDGLKGKEAGGSFVYPFLDDYNYLQFR